MSKPTNEDGPFATPSRIHRLGRWVVCSRVVCIVVVVVAAIGIREAAGGLRRLSNYALAGQIVPGLMGAGTTLVAYGLFRTRRSLRRHVDKHHGEVCVRCLYPLDTAVGNPNCSECGSPANVEACKEYWRRNEMWTYRQD
jgi:hypothetical protein